MLQRVNQYITLVFLKIILLQAEEATSIPLPLQLATVLMWVQSLLLSLNFKVMYSDRPLGAADVAANPYPLPNIPRVYFGYGIGIVWLHFQLYHTQGMVWWETRLDCYTGPASGGNFQKIGRAIPNTRLFKQGYSSEYWLHTFSSAPAGGWDH